jgi:membrane protein YdbS with pleckstrin-like domain
MQIYIARDGQTHGPYSLEAIQAHLASGHVVPGDQAWFEGAPGWMPLHQVDGVKIEQGSLPPAAPVEVAAVQAYPHQIPLQPQSHPVPRHFPAQVNPQSYAQPHMQDDPEVERLVFEVTPTLKPSVVWLCCTLGLYTLFFIMDMLSNKACRYRLTTQRLVVTTGLVSRHVEEVELYRVKDVTVQQGFFGRMLNYGNVLVQVNDASTPYVLLRNVERPLQLKEQIRDQFRSARRSEGIRSVEYFPSA